MPEPTPREIVVNRRQALKVRIVLWICLAVLVLCLVGGWSLFHSYGLSPGDGGRLRPIGERLAFAGIVVLIGLATAGGMLLYARLYVLRITRTGPRLSIETMSLLGRRTEEFDVDRRAARTRKHHGRLSARQSVNAPWLTLRMENRRLPYIIDLQSETVDRNAIRRLARS